jgi:hypothetical protein
MWCLLAFYGCRHWAPCQQQKKKKGVTGVASSANVLCQRLGTVVSELDLIRPEGVQPVTIFSSATSSRL